MRAKPPIQSKKAKEKPLKTSVKRKRNAEDMKIEGGGTIKGDARSRKDLSDIIFYFIGK